MSQVQNVRDVDTKNFSVHVLNASVFSTRIPNYSVTFRNYLNTEYCMACFFPL